MDEEELTKMIKNSKTMPKLDDLRIEIVRMMVVLGQSNYRRIQKVFIKQKNKLLRIPLAKREW